MNRNRNTIATPLIAEAINLHRCLFNTLYPCPLQVEIKNGQLFSKVDSLFNLKYIPFVLAFVFIKTIIALGSCIFLLLLNFFQPTTNTNINVVEVVMCIFIGTCAILEIGTYTTYRKSSEMKRMFNEVFWIERTYYNVKWSKSTDWLGVFMIAVHLVLLSICFIMPFVGTLAELDPFYHIFELILPSPYERTIFLILVTYFIRLFICLVGIYEFARFISLHIFVCIGYVFTISNFLRKLFKSSKSQEASILQLYIQLRVVSKTCDYFLRHIIILLLICAQFLIVSIWWQVLKCWNILPIYMTLVFLMVAFNVTSTVSVLLPRAVEISDSSVKFIAIKRAEYHSFDRKSKKYYYFLKWSAQRMLPMRFGTQFTLTKKTPISYIDVLMVNLTNAILLVNP